MSSEAEKDLVVLVPDADTQQAVRALLGERTPSLGITPLRFDVHRHPQRDPGVYRRADDFLRPMAREYGHALVVFDLEGCGREDREPEEIEQEVEHRLQRSGWEGDRAATIVVAPELEAWIWGPRLQIAQILQVGASALRQAVLRFGVSGTGKLNRPKEALDHVLRHVCRRPRSSRLFAAFAQEMHDFDECQDRAFRKLLATLRRWFAQGE